jgi:hypothetical protein
MKPATREWIRCAEEDFDVAVALMRRRHDPARHFGWSRHREGFGRN